MWQALLQQGAMAFDAGDLPVAIQKLEGATELSPTAEAFTMLGAAYGRSGNPERAAAAFKQALRINPGFGPARQALGLVTAQ
jgi:Flp pilus assembly protein TadD